MAKKNNFSASLEETLPSFSQFKIDEKLEQETNNSGTAKKDINHESDSKPNAVNNSKTQDAEVQVKQEDKTRPETKEGLEFLKIKNSGKRSHFTTTLSEQAQSNIKKMSLALDINFNDVVENCINSAYQSHEKEFQRLIRKKLL